jgi:hypothetical protein
MKTVLIALLAIAIVVSVATTAEARNEFENGFKTELGAISARAAVGLGFGIAREVFAGGPYYEPYCQPAPPPVVRTVYVERRVYVPVRHVHHYRHHHDYRCNFCR